MKSGTNPDTIATLVKKDEIRMRVTESVLHITVLANISTASQTISCIDVGYNRSSITFKLLGTYS